MCRKLRSNLLQIPQCRCRASGCFQGSRLKQLARHLGQDVVDVHAVLARYDAGIQFQLLLPLYFSPLICKALLIPGTERLATLAR
jgi:hypothetical protein